MISSWKKACAALAALVGLGASCPATADVVTFDDSVGQSLVYTYYAPGESFSDQGLTFTSHGTDMYLWGPFAANSNGTNNNLFAGFATGDFETITKTGGGVNPGESGEGFRWRLGWRGSHRPMRRPFADLAGIAFHAGVSAD